MYSYVWIFKQQYTLPDEFYQQVCTCTIRCATPLNRLQLLLGVANLFGQSTADDSSIEVIQCVRLQLTAKPR